MTEHEEELVALLPEFGSIAKKFSADLERLFDADARQRPR